MSQIAFAVVYLFNWSFVLYRSRTISNAIRTQDRLLTNIFRLGKDCKFRSVLLHHSSCNGYIK